MKRTLLIVTLFGLLAISQASFFSSTSDDDGNVVVKFQVETDEPRVQSSPFSFFRPFRFLSRDRSRHEPRLSLFSDDEPDISGFFDRMFHLPSLEMQQESPINVVHVRIIGDDDSNAAGNDGSEQLFGFSRMFTRMTSLLDSLRAQSGFTSQDSFFAPSKPIRRRGGCTLIQACGSDIDQVCGYAKRLNLANAIPNCLKAHRSQLSERCGTFMDRRGDTEDDSSEETQEDSEIENSDEFASSHEEEESADNMQTAELVEHLDEQPAEEPQPTVPQTPQEACRQAAQTLCPETTPANMVGLMSCLAAHEEVVPALCLDTIKDTAAFNCAHDAERFCPGVNDRRAIGRCLKPHKAELSPKCVAAAKKMTPAAVSKSVNLQNIDTPTTIKASTPDAVAQPGSNGNAVLIMIGISGFVVLVVAITVVVVRRRRAAARSQPVVSTVQLVNPSYGALPQVAPQSYSAAFQPRPEDEL